MYVGNTKQSNGVTQLEVQMNTKRFSIKLYVALSLLILVMIGLVGCGTLEVGALPDDAASVSNGDAVEADEVQITGIEIGIEPTPMPENLTYSNDFYGFKFDYPETWTLKEKDHGVVLKNGTNRLGINFRWVNESFNFGRTGFGGGTPIYSDKVYFMRQVIPEYVVELEHLAKFVVYSDTSLVEIDDLAFGIVLEDLITNYMTLDLPDEIIAEAKTILESFEKIEATGSPGDVPPTPEATVINPVSPDPDWTLYSNPDYDFGFFYPPSMTVVEEPNLLKIGRDSLQLLIGFRRVDENVKLVEPTTDTGQEYPIEEIDFLGQEMRIFLNSFDDHVKAVYFGDGPVVKNVGNLIFAIRLLDTSVSEIGTGAEIGDALIEEMTEIVKSFGRFKTASSPEVVSPDPGDPIVAWLGHIASMPEGSRFDDMVVLSPDGTGELGLTGATPDIEAEIHSLRDAEDPNEYVHFWGNLLLCSIDDYNNNNCQLVVERMQYGANYSEEDIHDWFGTIKKSTFNGGESYVFELFSQFPMWYGIDASQDESLQTQLEHFLETNETVEISGKLMVGVPDVNGTRIEISSIEARSVTGSPRPDILDGPVYENREYGFTFRYPSYMSVVEEPNKVLVNNGTLQLTIAYRRADENILLAETGELTGQFHSINDVYFLGSFVQTVLNIHDGYITAAYLGDPGVELGEGTPLRFVVSLVNTDGTRISNGQVDEMLQIFQSFGLASWSE